MSSPAPDLARGADDERRALARTFLCALLVYGVFLWPFEGEVPLRYLDLTRALLEQGTLRVDAYQENTSDLARVGAHHYLAAAPAPSFLGLPAYALGRVLGGSPFAGQAAMTLLLGPVAGALAVALWLRLVTRLGAPPEQRPWLVLAYGLATFAFPLATALYPHTLTNVLALGALLAAHEHAERGTPGTAVAAGALAGALPAAEYPSAVVVPALLLWLVALRQGGPRARLRSALLFAFGAAGPLLLLGAYHAACFGAPWRTGYAFHKTQEIRAIQATGLAGFSWPTPHTLFETVLGGARGLLLFAPPVAVAALAAPAMVRGARLRVGLGVGVGLAFVLLHAARQSDWYGGFTWGPRYQATALPFWLLVLAGPGWPAWTRRALPVATLAGAVVSLVGAGGRWPQTLGSALREASTFGLQAKGLGPLLGAGHGYHPAGVEALTPTILLLTTLGLLGALAAIVLLWGRPPWLVRGGAAVGLALVLVQANAALTSRGREAALRSYLRDREFIAFAGHFRHASNFVNASAVALRLGDREEAAALAERALALEPGREDALLALALARGDRAALQELRRTARDPAVREQAALALGEPR